MVGNAADARLALEMCESGDNSALIGEGATRRVYKIGSVVYKVVYYVFDGFDGAVPEGNTNVDEFESAHWYRDIDGINIPNMEMYGDVLAMEYVPGDLTGECESEWLNLPCECPTGHIPTGMQDALNDAGYDTTWGNIIRNRDGYWLIDMAH